MHNYEYRSSTIDFDSGIFTRKGTTSLDKTLNEECKEGWRLKQIIMPTDSNGMTSYMVVVLERLLPE